MAKMLLTEALADHKITLKKIADKTAGLAHYSVRPEFVKDPLEKSGTTSDKFISEELQAIGDLAKYAVDLKTGIAAVNRTTNVTFGVFTMTVEQALTWRREVAPLLKQTYDGLLAHARNSRTVRSRETNEPVKMIVNFDEKEIMSKLAALNDALGQLDTKLSLVNATSTVEV